MIRTRFAPSPTGYMHIGNLRTALYEYLIAKSQNGKFILRIEDTDQERFIEGATDVIFNTLKLTGLSPDEDPVIGGDYGPYIQSQRIDIYNEYAQKLIDNGNAYYCFCTKERLDQIRHKEGDNSKDIVKYDRHCLSLSQSEIEQNLKSNMKYVIRQKMPIDGETIFEDAVFGRISVDNSELDDQILIKSDGMPTYNFANVVDDHLMEITHVVRGDEYLTSTPKYNLLYDAFGWNIPIYVHLPPVMKNQTEKLSKRKGDASFEDLLELGFLSEAIINYIALLGWSPLENVEIFSLEELTKSFKLSGLSKSPSIFDIVKLTWMNGEYIKKMSFDEFYEITQERFESCIASKEADIKKIAQLVQTRIGTFNEIGEFVDFIDVLPDYDCQLFIHKKMKTTFENSLESLKICLPELQKIENWEEQTIHDVLMTIAKDKGLKNSQIMWPIRTALSGKESSPGGATELAYIVGKNETINRIQIGIDKLENVKEV